MAAFVFGEWLHFHELILIRKCFRQLVQENKRNISN